MNISAPFIARPVATTLVAIAIALAGMLSFYVLPVAPMPQIEFPTITVQASLPGASPEIMATSVATPLERHLTRIAGITEMTSSSTLGSARVVVQFDLSRDINGAARDVQAAINASADDLPANLPTHPTYRKANPADAPIMIIALTSDIYDRAVMYDVASTILQQTISKVSGVGQVTIGGGSLPAVRVELNPMELNKYGLGIDEIGKTIRANNVNSASGQLSHGEFVSNLKLNSQLLTAEQYRPMIVSYKNGQTIRLSDVAEVVDSVQDLRNAGMLNGKTGISIIIFKEPGANVINTVDNVRNIMPQLKEMIKPGIDMHLVLDRTVTIRAALHDVELTLIMSVIFVICVVYASLRNVRATMIPGTAMVLSLLGTFCGIYLAGFSLNTLSLMALTISTGFVIDDAIVVLENISRYIEGGMKPKEAALKGTEEIGFTILSISISLIAVFIPILCMGGIVGKIFNEFAFTLAMSIFISMLISLTITPMMCAFLLESGTVKTKSVVKATRFYEHSLKLVLNKGKFALLATLLTIIISVLLYIEIPKGFFPQQDTGRIVVSMVSDQDISFQLLKKKFEKVMATIQQDPDIENVVGFIGGSNVNSGTLFIILKGIGIRKVTADAVINRLRPKLSNIPGTSIYMQSPQDISVGGRQANAQFQYTISADSIHDVQVYSQKIMQQLANQNGIADINSDQRDKGRQITVKLDYDAAASYHVTAAQVDKALYAAFGQSLVSTTYTVLNQYYVVLEVAPKYWQNPDILRDMYVLNSNGVLVPLASFASFEPTSTLLSVNHQGLSPSATLSFNLMPNVALGDAVAQVTDEVKNMRLPNTVQCIFRGTAEAFQSSLKNEPYLVLAAIISVYLVLGMLYENLIHPITILSTIPSAGVGALLALICTRTEFTVIALIGIILLIGIVKKNAIMMIDFALYIKKTGQESSREAIYNAALLRFRPIMMTTLAALLGALPLAFGSGVGSEFRKPLGISIIGGLIISQMLTLYTTPVVYLAMEKVANYCSLMPATLKRLVKKAVGNEI